MAKAELTSFQLLEDFAQSTTLEALESTLTKAEDFRDKPGSFVASKEKEERDREVRAKQSYEIDCRRKYEQRMARKAERLGVTVSEVMKASAVPGGTLSFSNDPSWLTEKGDVQEEAETSKGKGKSKGQRSRGSS